MPRPRYEVAEIFRRSGAAYVERHCGSLTSHQRRVIKAIASCRTAALGGHVDKCDWCGERFIFYNSCRDRHCPKCQALAKSKWLEQRKSELLPVPYFHVVFTVPACFARLALQNKRVVYEILFRSVAETLRRIAADPKHLGAEIGFLAILHTWGQNLHLHPHIHCVVPGGGLSPDGSRWVMATESFFLPVRVLSKMFRGVFMREIAQAYNNGQLRFSGTLSSLARPDIFARFAAEACNTNWNVYCKPPFGGPEQVLDYLGRYTHRVAISNERLLSIDNGRVRFRWRDYARANKACVMNLSDDAFIERFLLHELPPRFVRLRYYGFMANCHRTGKMQRIREVLSVPPPQDGPLQQLDWRNRYFLLTGHPIDTCTACRKGRLVLVEAIACEPLDWTLLPRMDSS